MTRCRRSLTASVLVLLCLETATTLHSATAATFESTTGGTAGAKIGANTFENRVLRQINKRRLARDLRKVRVLDPCLERYAEDWASTLAATGVLVHRDMSVVVATCDLTWAGETLARGEGLTPKQTAIAWMKSRPHKKVIMKARANRAGIGVRYDDEDRAVVVLNFGDTN